MGKYSQTLVKYLSEHLDGSIEKCSSGRGIYFCFDKIANGNRAYDMLMTETNAPFRGHDTRVGLDKRDFTVFFGSRSERDNAFDALSTAIADYTSAHIDEIEDKYGTEDIPDSGEGDGEGSGSDTAIWIVGAATVTIILILLLWKN